MQHVALREGMSCDGGGESRTDCSDGADRGGADLGSRSPPRAGLYVADESLWPVFAEYRDDQTQPRVRPEFRARQKWVPMRLVTFPFAVVQTAVTAVTDTAGAVGGAVINGVAGGVQGAARGAAHGLNKGSRSTTTAALTLVAVGATGFVDWPIIIVVGGTGLLVRRLNMSRTATAEVRSPAVRNPTGPGTIAVPATPKRAPNAKPGTRAPKPGPRVSSGTTA